MSNYRKTMTQAIAEMYLEPNLNEGYQVYVKSPKAKSGWIAQGQPHKTEKDAKKDAESFAPEVTKVVKEEINEAATSQVLAHGGKGQYKVVSGPAKDGSRETVVKFKGKVVSKGDYDRGADGWYMNIKGKKGQEFFDDAQKMADYFAKNKITEGKEKNARQLVDPKKEVMVVKKNNVIVIDKTNQDYYLKKGWALAEEIELDEAVSAKDFDALKKGDTVIIDYKSTMSSGTAKFTVSAKNMVGKGKKVEKVTLRNVKNPKGVKHFLYKRDDKVGFAIGDMGASVVSFKKEEMNEGAAADARRHARQDKDFGRGKDSADVDDDATDDDVKGASKNIIMQMRKAVNLRGNFKVEFGDKKKVKIPVKVAQAVQDKFNSIKKPADKEKFQAQVAKSYKDMLRVLKAGYNEEIQDKKIGPTWMHKEETILNRVDRQIKEKENG